VPNEPQGPGFFKVAEAQLQILGPNSLEVVSLLVRGSLYNDNVRAEVSKTARDTLVSPSLDPQSASRGHQDAGSLGGVHHHSARINRGDHLGSAVCGVRLRRGDNEQPQAGTARSPSASAPPHAALTFRRSCRSARLVLVLPSQFPLDARERRPSPKGRDGRRADRENG
jgi:hypothetical protein